ncbi:MAG: hypothetical protein LJF04_09375 [Gemmatimonadetes bacterium]|nr:hypothetical protein [Gemmatimonadota bacterium]
MDFAKAELDETSDLLSRLHVHLYSAIIGWYGRDTGAVREDVVILGQSALQMGENARLALEGLLGGWCLLEDGSSTQALRVLEGAIEGLDASHWTVWRPFIDATLADALTRAGRAGETMLILDQALEAIDRTGERAQEAEVDRIRGEALLAPTSSEPHRGEAAFRRAMDIAHGQEARLFELRATTSLAGLLRSHGRTEEAHSILRGVYDWFTEGFDTVDLREAAALLGELEEGHAS